MRRQSQAGFTIVELLIVVAIMGILAILVLPSVKANALRVKMSEALLAFGPCRNAVTEIFAATGEPPADGVWGCENSSGSQYVSNVAVDANGVIKISVTNIDLRVNTMDVTLAPLDNTGSSPAVTGSPVRSWRCGSGLDGTQVSSQFLPSSCRG